MVEGTRNEVISLMACACDLTLSSLALLFSLYAMLTRRAPFSPHFTYGLSRLETLSAFTNCTYLYFVSLFAIFHHVHSFFEPHHTQPENRIQLICVLLSLVGTLSFQGYSHVSPLETHSQVWPEKYTVSESPFPNYHQHPCHNSHLENMFTVYLHF